MAETVLEAGCLGEGDEDGLRVHARDDALVVSTLAAHAPALLRTARRYSSCADDAQDAYQRALEIFVRRAATLRRETVASWLHTVVKHEAMAVRAQRAQLVTCEEVDLDAHEADHAPSVEERVVGFDRTARAAEALTRLKPQEVTALWLKAQGLSYQEIAERQGWSYTKVNRCLTEGRRAFLERFAGIESGAECERWAPVISAMLDGEATSRELRELRPHLRRCSACRSSVRELRDGGRTLAGVLPVGLFAAGGPRRLLARLWEALGGGVHDRLAVAVVHGQTAGEGATAMKLAAIAGSAAALAGGAITVERASTAPHTIARPGRAGHVAQAHAPRRPAPLAAPVARPPAATAPAAAPPASAPAYPRAHAPGRTRDELGLEGGGGARPASPATIAAATPAAAAQPVPAPAPTTGSGAGPGDELGVE